MKYFITCLMTALFAATALPGQATFQNGTDRDAFPDTTRNTPEPGEYTVENNGLRIWYKVSGEGPVCILPSPGWGPGSELYYNSMGDMEKWFTMVYVDTRGTGRSGRPEMEQYTTSGFLSDLEAVRENLGAGHVWLMGHSKGGALVLNYAYENRDRVDGIILIDASGGVNTPPEKMQFIMEQKKDEPWFARAAEYFSRQPRDEADWLTGIQAIMPVYFSTTEGFEKCKDVLTGTSLSYHAFQGQENWYDCEHELEAKLPGIDMPVLVVVGMDDFICGPYVAAYLHRKLHDSKLLPVEHAGHFPWLEQPGSFFGGIRDFLPALHYPGPELLREASVEKGN